MKDMTRGSIVRHLLGLAVPIAIGMLFQMLYVMVDLYFVAGLGDAAVAGLVTAGNIQFVVLALTQVLGAGAMALIAQAVGGGDQADAALVFNQSLLIACVCAVLTLAIGYGGADFYMRSVAADDATRVAGTTYLHWFLPGMALQFALVAMGSALRGTGIARPGMIVQVSTVALNALLAPVFVAGWLTHRPMGIAGAGLASSISIAVGVAMMTLYFARREKYIRFDAISCMPDAATWKRILRIGLPPGGEFVILFVFLAVIYAVIRPFGAAAQAGFGIGSRLNQAIFLPAMAVAFSVAPLAGQNFGARRLDRVRETFRAAAIIGSSIMIALTLLCQWKPEWLMHAFTSDPAVVAIGSGYLLISSWNFVAQCIIFSCSGMFQAFGRTLPSLYASTARLVVFAIPVLWLSRRAGFELDDVWHLVLTTVTAQMCISVFLLKRALQREQSMLVPSRGHRWVRA
jgi:putative MATE family efflux protein